MCGSHCPVTERIVKYTTSFFVNKQRGPHLNINYLAPNTYYHIYAFILQT